MPSKRQITDRELLGLVERGSLIVDVNAGAVYVRDRRGGEPRRKAEAIDRNGYHSVEIYIGSPHTTGRRRKVTVHRLVWMVANGRAVPWKHDVHHTIPDLNNNGIGNLELQQSGPHRSEARRGGWERAWALANGYSLGNRGRIPAAIMEAYDARQC